MKNHRIKTTGRLMPGDLIDLDGEMFRVVERHASGRGIRLLNLETEQTVNIPLKDQIFKKFGLY
jgi:hypothetical protein